MMAQRYLGEEIIYEGVSLGIALDRVLVVSIIKQKKKGHALGRIEKLFFEVYNPRRIIWAQIAKISKPCCRESQFT